MMLDPRKPYVLRIKDKSKRIDFRDEEQGALPSIAINARVEHLEDERGVCLCYYDVGCERGHALPGRIVKIMKNGIVFDASRLKWRFTLTELTYDEFNERIRPYLSEWESRLLNDLDDVQVYYRKQANLV